MPRRSAGYVSPKPFAKGFDPRRNLRGRPKGSRDRTPRSIHEILVKNGFRDPVEILGEFANSGVVPPELRIQAATAMCRFVHGPPSSLKFIDGLTGMRAPSTIQEALAYQARIVELLAGGEIDVDSAGAIQTALRGFIEDKVAIELAERLEKGEALLREYEARGIGAAQVVPVGGMPVMPGTENLILPHRGPPTIEATANPWADRTSEVAATVKAAPGGQKRAARRSKPKPGPEPPDLKTAPEPPEGA
jgi:hypothetical protein